MEIVHLVCFLWKCTVLLNFSCNQGFSITCSDLSVRSNFVIYIFCSKWPQEYAPIVPIYSIYTHTHTHTHTSQVNIILTYMQQDQKDGTHYRSYYINIEEEWSQHDQEPVDHVTAMPETLLEESRKIRLFWSFSMVF